MKPEAVKLTGHGPLNTPQEFQALARRMDDARLPSEGREASCTKAFWQYLCDMLGPANMVRPPRFMGIEIKEVI